jgi:hypothetical protein
MVLPDSDLLSRVRSYSGAAQTPSPFAYGTLTPSGTPFQVLRLGYLVFNVRSYNPTRGSEWFGLFRFRSPLLTESRFLSFPPATEMFQFAGLATATYAFSGGWFGHLGIIARLTAPPSFSQFSTPFFAFWCQDIPHTPLVAWPH